MILGKKAGISPVDLAKQEYGERDPHIVEMVQKANISAVNTTTDAALIGNEGGFADYVEYLRNQTIVGRFGQNGIPALRRVPFYFPVVTQATGGTAYWVGEGAAKPMTKPTWTRTELTPLTVAALTASTIQALRFSSPSAEMALRDDLTAAVVEAIDTAFIDPATHGTTAIESAALARFDRANADAAFVPFMCVWNNSEGGQGISSILENPADPDKHYFENFVKVITRVQAVKPANVRAVYRWELFDQGEGNSTSDTLGTNHALLRTQMEAQVQAIFGQSEPLRMVSLQPSTFLGSAAGNGAPSILQYALDNETAFGNFWCLGPTYHLPFSSDLLHKSSIGHDMQGQEYEAAIMSVERTGYWRPLHAVSPAITGANEITFTLSEAAELEDDGPVLAIANAGFVVPGKTITNVDVTGTSVTITADEAAAGATSVQIAMNGHEEVRTAATFARTNVRSTASYGSYRSGQTIRKWLCHQQISIS